MCSSSERVGVSKLKRLSGDIYIYIQNRIYNFTIHSKSTPKYYQF